MLLSVSVTNKLQYEELSSQSQFHFNNFTILQIAKFQKMEQVFSVGDKAEAVDSVGCWALCTVKEIRDQDYFVGFDGWTTKWDLPVRQSEIRPVTQREAVSKAKKREQL